MVNPFRAPEPLPILNPSNFVPKTGFPVVKKGVKCVSFLYLGVVLLFFLFFHYSGGFCFTSGV